MDTTAGCRDIAITPLTATLGARLDGLDLSAGLDDQAIEAVRTAFWQWHVISIPGQRLSPDQVVGFSTEFGPVEPHIKAQFHHPDTPLIIVLSNRLVDDKPIGSQDGGTFWHSDVAYRERPALGTLLYSVEVPDQGGDTLFTDMIQAYDDLPADMKRRLDGLKAEHDYAKADEISTGTERSRLSDAERKLVPPVAHPVVRTHPATGRKALYVSPAYTRCVLGLRAADSEALLNEIYDHCLQDKYRLVYRWQQGDVVIWDNMSVMHSATTATHPIRGHRTLWRTIISGDVPV